MDLDLTTLKNASVLRLLSWGPLTYFWFFTEDEPNKDSSPIFVGQVGSILGRNTSEGSFKVDHFFQLLTSQEFTNDIQCSL